MTARPLDRRTLAALCDRPFGSRLCLVAIIRGVGRLYLNTWRSLECCDDCYVLTGFERTRKLTRKQAAVILRQNWDRMVRPCPETYDNVDAKRHTLRKVYR